MFVRKLTMQAIKLDEDHVKIRHPATKTGRAIKMHAPSYLIQASLTYKRHYAFADLLLIIFLGFLNDLLLHVGRHTTIVREFHAVDTTPGRH